MQKSKINKFIVNYIIPITIAFISAGLFVGVWSRAKEGQFYLPIFVLFLLSVSAGFFWIIFTKTINIGRIMLFSCLFVLFVFFIIMPPYKRKIKMDLGIDPFFRGTHITAISTVKIWEKEFWMNSEKILATKGEQIKKRMQKDRMLVNAGKDDVVGWTEEEVIFAFGEPKKKIAVSEDEEIWIYNAWKNNLEWEMPVYIKNKKLKQIGD